MMAALTLRYQGISPVTLQVEAGVVSSTLYCGEVAGLSGGLVESFLVELYRCKLCQFTCGLKASISSHLLLKHRPPTFTYLGGANGEDRADDREETGLQRGASPFQMDLNGESKQSDEDEGFLLYNMLGNMSPPACDIRTEGGLQVAHTCEVSTLFVEENTMFPLKGGPVDLSLAIDPSNTQEEMAQSAHLMTLGLCRISAPKPPPPSPSKPACHSSEDRPPIEDRPPLSEGPKSNGTNGGPSRTPSGRQSLVCLLCPLTLPSQRLLDIHVRSHRAGGGFSCVCCSWIADRWDQVELHWRSHCRRKRRRREEQQKKKTEPLSSSVTQQTPEECHQHSNQSDRTRRILIGRQGRKRENRTDRSGPRKTGRPGTSQTSSCCSGPPDRRKTRTIDKKEDEETGFRCSLCHRKFSSKLTLRRHLGVHGGEKPYNCPHCSYRSRLKASLLQHLRTHTGEKPFRCGQCSYASIDSSSLLRHIRTHSQEKPYRCQLCDYSSIQKKSLDLHARRHHTGEAFPCQHCQYSSPDRQLLLRHVRRHHTPS